MPVEIRGDCYFHNADPPVLFLPFSPPKGESFWILPEFTPNFLRPRLISLGLNLNSLLYTQFIRFEDFYSLAWWQMIYYINEERDVSLALLNIFENI